MSKQTMKNRTDNHDKNERQMARKFFFSTNNEKLNEQSYQELTPGGAQVFITFVFTLGLYIHIYMYIIYD